jgi:alcohol dehydrogenase (cytochrome c)
MTQNSKHWHYAVVGGLALAMLSGASALAQDAKTRLANISPVTDDMLQKPADGDWLTYRRQLNGWGYSPLDQVNTGNVTKLRLVWSRLMNTGQLEGTPSIHEGIMFLPHPGDVLQAIDAATGDLLWEYRRKVPEGVYASGERKRSVALYGDNIYMATWDNHVLALSMKTGQIVWDTERPGGLDVSNTSGPIAMKGTVAVGSTCAYTYPGGCYAAAYDATSGEEMWLNYVNPRPGEPGDETWGGLPLESRIHTGVWGGFSYDPELDLIYYGSSSTAPSSPTIRGTPLWDKAPLLDTDTRFAVKRETGEVVWKKQLFPGANWDEECTFEAVLDTVALKADPQAKGMLAIGAKGSSGEMHKVETGVPCKNPIVYTVDAATGEFYWAKQTGYETSGTYLQKVDTDGKFTPNPDMLLLEANKTYFVCPTFSGGRDWPPVSYNPNTKVLFIPTVNLCADMTPVTAEPPVLSYQVNAVEKLPPGEDSAGRVDAVSAETGATLWTYKQRAPNYSPTMATGGGLVFTGDQGRYFRAHDQKDGKLLWSIRLPSEVEGHAVTYTVDGTQYVAVEAGLGGSGGGHARVVPDVDFAGGSNAVYVFKLSE